MKLIKITAIALGVIVLSSSLQAAEAKEKSKGKKAYPLKTCIVSDEKLGGMGDPFVFVHAGQEIKLCCKNCKKDFDKEPGKYLKKLEGSESKKK